VIGLRAANTRGEPTTEITGIEIDESAADRTPLGLEPDLD